MHYKIVSLTFPPRAFVLKEKLTLILIFILLCGASKGLMKAFMAIANLETYSESSQTYKMKFSK